MLDACPPSCRGEGVVLILCCARLLQILTAWADRGLPLLLRQTPYVPDTKLEVRLLSSPSPSSTDDMPRWLRPRSDAGAVVDCRAERLPALQYRCEECREDHRSKFTIKVCRGSRTSPETDQ